MLYSLSFLNKIIIRNIKNSGQISTQAFVSFNINQRKCHLEHEVLAESNFRIHTENNCKYECHVEHAKDVCQCIPWDFMHNTEMSECDVFGRTCFLNVMEN